MHGPLNFEFCAVCWDIKMKYGSEQIENGGGGGRRINVFYLR
jgi:hypothetical protein